VSEPAAEATRTQGARFFTARQEIGACGYVTIALATALADLGVWSGRGDGYRIVAPGGTYDLAFGAPSAGSPRPVRLAVRILGHEPGVDAGLVQQLTGLELLGDYQPEIVSTGLRHLVVPIADPAALRAYVPRRPAAEELGRVFGVDTIGLVSLDRGTRVHLRDLCAPIGDLEEPASGTTCAAVADYLARHGWPPAPASGGTSVYVISQGDELGRPSVISAGAPAGDRVVSIAGSARPILTDSYTSEPGQGQGPAEPAGYSWSGTRSPDQAASTGATTRQASSASSPRMDRAASPFSTSSSSRP
jgi:predicted PhzF superfamily epimerase YddE/YHI9